jgi:hypothetical protein
VFDMMTPQQRYLLDVQGFLHLKGALSPDEVAQARQAAERYMETPPEKLPPGFGIDGRLHKHGFAFDPALQALTLHPAYWPIVLELTRGKPRLVSGTLQASRHDLEDEALRLHCAREDWGWESSRFESREGRIFSDHIVVFPYLSDVKPGDGGVVVLPGSHKAHFERPPDLYGGGTLGDGPLPEGLINVTPQAGDVVIISESLTHGALPWKPKDRRRIILVLRYRQQTCGAAPLPEEITARLGPQVRELVAAAGHQDCKEIAKTGRVELEEAGV